MTEHHSADRLADVTIGWVGLGRMGTAMATRLVESGADVAVWNRTAAKADALLELGAELLPELIDAAGRDVVFSMVLDDAALDALHNPERGLLSGDGASRRMSRPQPELPSSPPPSAATRESSPPAMRSSRSRVTSADWEQPKRSAWRSGVPSTAWAGAPRPT
jgi:hypothetical protein